MKTCGRCKITKENTEFHKNKSNKDGLHFLCKTCRKKESIDRKQHTQKYNQSYWNKNKEILTRRNKKYRIENEDKINKQRKEYRNRPEIRIHNKQKAEEYKPIRNKKNKERRKTDLNFRLKEVIKSKFHKFIKGERLYFKEVIGLEQKMFIKWIEFLWNDKMNWDNYGIYWDIDHILPLSCFNFQNKKEIKICYNWKNMQPLESKENRHIKSNKIQLHHFFNNFISSHRFIQNNKLDSIEYQGMKETLYWLREKLRQGNNLTDNMDNPQPNL